MAGKKHHTQSSGGKKSTGTWIRRRKRRTKRRRVKKIKVSFHISFTSIKMDIVYPFLEYSTYGLVEMHPPFSVIYNFLSSMD